MDSPVTKFLTAALLVAASLAAGAQTLLTQIPLDSFAGVQALVDVAVNSATNRIYVPIEFIDYNSYGTAFSYNYFRVLVINGATNQVVHNVANFPSGSWYRGVAIDPVRNFTYVEMSNSIPAGDVTQCTVSVIDGQTEETVKTISLPPGDCGKMVVDPVTGKVYIGAPSGLEVIESEATATIETFNVPVGFGALAVSPYVHRLYFTRDVSTGTYNLGFFDTLDDQISKGIITSTSLNASVAGPVVNPATGHIFGTTGGYSEGSGESTWVTVFDSSASLLATIIPPISGGTSDYPGSDTVLGMDVDPKTNLAFVFATTDSVTGGGGATGTALDVIDGASNTVLSEAASNLPANTRFYGGQVGVNPDTGRVYVPYNVSPKFNPFVNGTFYLNVYSEQ